METVARENPGLSQPASTLEEANRCLRDIIALSILPTLWLGAKPQRIAESLLTALDTTVEPRLTYMRVQDDGGEPIVEHAHFNAQPTAVKMLGDLPGRIQSWSAEHDPNELLAVPAINGFPALRICAYPLSYETARGVLAAGFVEADLPTALHRVLLNTAANQVMTACKNYSLHQQTEAARKEAEMLNVVARTLAAELDLQQVVQKATDAATELTGAKFGAFFYNVLDEKGEAYLLYTLSGAPREAFEKLGMPRNTRIFAATFSGTGVMRSGDILKHRDYGKNPPHNGMPKGHLPVRSYLAVPVISRSGEVLGGLFFGHPETDVFTERSERIAVGIAAQAAIAIDNANLYGRAQMEIEQRKRTEEALQRSHAELQAQAQELTRFNRVAVGRESRMIELKKEINRLLEQAGLPRRYPLAFEEAGIDDE